MILRILLLACISIYFLGCNNDKQPIAESAKDISKMAEAKNNSIPFEGKFVKIEKLNSRDYCLFLKGDEDTITTFITMMPINDNEIQLLKKDGNNIKLNYSNFYNPVRKKNEKMVKYMQPIYQFEKNNFCQHTLRFPDAFPL